MNDPVKKIHSYTKVLNIGHKALTDLFKDPVYIEEKVDGSQFSFGVLNGELTARSKSVEILIDAPEPMFNEGNRNNKEIKTPVN